MIAERLTSLTPSTVDPTAVRSDVFSNHSPIEVAGAMSGLTDIQTELIMVMYLDHSPNHLKKSLLVEFASHIKPIKGRYQHLPSVIHSELKEVMSDNICEKCHGQRFKVSENKLIPCTYCKNTGKARPSLKLKSKWYTEMRQYLISEYYTGRKIEPHKIKADYSKYIRDAFHVYSWLVNEHNKAVNKIKRKLS